MAVVCLVAADLAVIKSLYDTVHVSDAMIVTLPMINLLILTLPRLKGRTTPFWAGFQAVGWIVTLLLAYLAWAENSWLFWPVKLFGDKLTNYLGSWQRLAEPPWLIIFISFVVLLYSTVLVLLSMLGGWLSARWVRRQSPE